MSNIKRNFLYNIVYQLLIIIIPLVTIPYLSRILGADGLGEYTYTFSIADYFVLFAMLGIKNYGNRSIAACQDDKNERSKVFWGIYTNQIIASAFVLVGYVVYILAFKHKNTVLAWVALFYVASAALDISWFFFGIEKFKVTVTRAIFIKLIATVLIFLTIKEKSDLWKYMLIMAGSAFLSNAILWFLIKGEVVRIRIAYRDVTRHIKPNLVLFLPTIAISLYHVMDKIMLGNLAPIEQVGYYENCEKIITVAYCVITALGTVMLPRMSNLIAIGRIEEGRKYIEKSMKLVFFMSAAIAFGISAVAPILVPVFLGEHFMPCVRLLEVLSVLVFIKAWANVIRTQYLLPAGMDRQYVISVSMGAVVNLLINALLIPKMGAMGAVIGTLAAEFMVAFYQTISTWHALDCWNYIWTGIPFIVVGIVMFVIVRMLLQFIAYTGIGLALLICVGAVIYLLLSMLWLRICQDEDMILLTAYCKQLLCKSKG